MDAVVFVCTLIAHTNHPTQATTHMHTYTSCHLLTTHITHTQRTYNHTHTTHNTHLHNMHSQSYTHKPYCTHHKTRAPTYLIPHTSHVQQTVTHTHTHLTRHSPHSQQQYAHTAFHTTHHVEPHHSRLPLLPEVRLPDRKLDFQRRAE